MYTTVHIILRLESIPTQYMSHTQQYTIYVGWSLFPHSTCHVHNNTLYTQDGVYSHMVHATYTTIHYTLRMESIPTWYMPSTQLYTIYSGWSLFPHGTCQVHNSTYYTQGGVYSRIVHAMYTTVYYTLRLESLQIQILTFHNHIISFALGCIIIVVKPSLSILLNVLYILYLDYIFCLTS